MTEYRLYIDVWTCFSLFPFTCFLFSFFSLWPQLRLRCTLQLRPFDPLPQVYEYPDTVNHKADTYKTWCRRSGSGCPFIPTSVSLWSLSFPLSLLPQNTFTQHQPVCVCGYCVWLGGVHTHSYCPLVFPEWRLHFCSLQRHTPSLAWPRRTRELCLLSLSLSLCGLSVAVKASTSVKDARVTLTLHSLEEEEGEEGTKERTTSIRTSWTLALAICYVARKPNSRQTTDPTPWTISFTHITLLLAINGPKPGSLPSLSLLWMIFSPLQVWSCCYFCSCVFCIKCALEWSEIRAKWKSSGRQIHQLPS